MRFPFLIATVVMLGFVGAPAGKTAAPLGTSKARVVNVTADSAPGWIPSEELEQQARATALKFLAAKDQARYADAYGLLADLDRRDRSMTEFERRVAHFNAAVGSVEERRILAVTWTKDPAQAPLRGVYAAIDTAGRFTKAERDCGYLVLYQPTNGGDFRVMREEDNFLDNSTASQIAKGGGDVEAAWAKVSANCPNYRLASTPAQAPIAEKSSSTIGYASVAAALEELRKRPGVTISTQQGWTIADDESSHALWSFAPAGHPAYPSAVKRQVVEASGQVSIKMDVLCEAAKAACDDLVRDFQQLNERVKAEMAAKRP